MATTKKYVSLEKLGLYDEKIKKYLADADDAALKSAKDYADGLAENYDAAGSAATAEANAKAYADGKDAAIAEAKKAGTDAAAAAAIADGKAVAAQGEVDALEAYVGTIPAGATATNIVGYVQEKTSGIATEGAMTELGNRVGVVEGKVATIEGDYLKAADKTEIQGKIDAVQGAVDTLSGTHATDKKALEDAIALKADKTELEAVSAVANAAATKVELKAEEDRAKGEEARIEGLVSAEAERAAGVESGLNERLEEVEAFFKLAEGESLDAALDTLVEIQGYITGEGAAADKMVEDIAANAKAIEDMDAAYKAADETLQGNIDALSGVVDTKAAASDVEALDGRVETAEGKITAVEGAVATKAEQSALEEAVEALEDADSAQVERIAALEAKFGEGDGSVEEMIADVKAEVEAELAEAIADAKADASNKDAVVLAEAQKGIAAVQAAVDTHTGNADIHVTADDKAKWNAALQAADITVGSANGTIAVKGADVAVKGLGSAAYVATTAFDASGSAAQALVDAKAYVDSAMESIVEVSEQEILDMFK
jgi:hypothetical protein